MLGTAATCGQAAPLPGTQNPDTPTPRSAALPVKEVTVFKDGHAFVVQEGTAPTSENGGVVLDSLPSPVIGTFWAYAPGQASKVTSVRAGMRRTAVDSPAVTLREMIKANPGAEVTVTEVDGTRYPATLVGPRERQPADPATPTPAGADLTTAIPPEAASHPVAANPLITLRTGDGTKVLPLDRIRDLVFKTPPQESTRQEEERPALTLNLDWRGQPPQPTAHVGLMYLQKGIRWIPSYKVDLDGNGQARVQLQATVLNELIDLSKTSLQLVIGMPSFYFKDTIDPIALQQAATQLSQFFQSDPSRGRASALANNFSNSLMTQVARAGDFSPSGAGPEAGAPSDLPEGSRNEDLFVFTVPEVTLKKGERIVLPLLDITVPYEDVFTLHLPISPPNDMRHSLANQQQAELARLFNAPKVTHKARLRNRSQIPFTTAPALLLREGRVLAQALMTYAAPNASADITITSALDIAVQKTDRETGRTPNALNYNNNSLMRVDLEGRLVLTNHKSTPVEVEVIRHALGHIDTADNGGSIEMSNVFEGAELAAGEGAPEWWGWYNWPWWWNQVNGIGRITWKTKLEPGKPVELGYRWHYFWH